MKKKIRQYHYINRTCPICSSDAIEPLKTIEGKRQGVHYEHFLNSHVSICKTCGFLFSNPVTPQEELAEYYGDMLSIYETESSYSIENRMMLIKKYAKGGSIAELGANEEGPFKKQLETIFTRYDSVDINTDYGSDYKTLSGLSDGFDMLVGYHVLEHISELEAFMMDCYSKLKTEGICIMEVPDAGNYYKDAHCLSITEHVNHFTPASLTELMWKFGFELLEISRVYASREQGFVGVYRKKAIPKCKQIFPESNYIINKSILLEGVAKMEHNQEVFSATVSRLHEIAESVKNGRGEVAFWCANEMLTKIINGFLEVYESFEALIIDEDIRKREFYLDYSAKTSKEAWKSGELDKAEILIICSGCRVESIVKTLQKRYPQRYEALLIYFIDEEWNINAYQK